MNTINHFSLSIVLSLSLDEANQSGLVLGLLLLLFICLIVVEFNLCSTLRYLLTIKRLILFTCCISFISPSSSFSFFFSFIYAQFLFIYLLFTHLFHTLSCLLYYDCIST